MTEEEKQLIINTPIDETCFEKWQDYKYEEVEINNFDYPDEKRRFCSIKLYPTSIYESLIRDCEVIRRKYLETKNEHYLDMLVHLLPNTYKVVKL